VNVVVTREAGYNNVIRAWLPMGTVVEEVPLTTTAYADIDDVRAAIEESPRVGTFRTLVVTSERTARYVDLVLATSANDVEVFCVGPSTAAALRSGGVRISVTGESTGEDLARQVSNGPVLILGAKTSRGEMRSSLLAKGLEVLSVSCYETIPLTLEATDVTKVQSADVLFIGAPSAWAAVREFVGAGTWVVVPGATTAAIVHQSHARVLQGWGPALATRLLELSLPG
jgi:uroporphyrinogen-III synthase